VAKFISGKVRHFNAASNLRLIVACGSLANSGHLSLIFNLQVKALYSNGMSLVRNEVQGLLKSDRVILYP
jgi:tetrahydromethanopterin S-methyltransferase subunit A